MPKRKVKIKMDDLLEYFEEGSYEVQYFLDIEKGEVITLMEWDEDEKLREEIEFGGERYILLPEQDSRTGYRDMVDFTETVEDQNLQEKLWIALDGKGAFRRFKDVLYNYPEERERWFKFQYEKKKSRLLKWLEDEEIEIEEPE